jgi:hypothetical protein
MTLQTPKQSPEDHQKLLRGHKYDAGPPINPGFNLKFLATLKVAAELSARPRRGTRADRRSPMLY